MAGFVIRPAEPGDAEQLALIHVRSWQTAYQGQVPQDYLDGLDPAERAGRWRRILRNTDPDRGGVLVAVASGPRILGFAGYGPSRDPDADGGRTGELTMIYLLPEALGQGAGRELMAAAVARMAGAGYAQATLWVLETNARARRFYAAAGWAQDGAAKTDDGLGFPLREVRYRRPLG
jgi:ribosomal protein S18 acetylase RimI-like enzyme